MSEAETLVRLTVRENGDRVSMIRALEEMLSALPVPPFADRRIALFREVGVLCYPGEVRLPEKLAKLTYPPGSALRLRLAGEALPLGARLVRLPTPSTPWCVDVERSHRCPCRTRCVRCRQRGRDFDPRLTDHFIALVRRLPRLEHGDLLAFLEDGAEIPEARHRLGKFT